MKHRIESIIFLLVLMACLPAVAQSKWKNGYFDIHNIATGKGDCTFLVFPDGRTMLIDAGDMTGYESWHSRPLPDSTHSPAYYISRYIKKYSPHPDYIDYVCLTHFHDDHMGTASAPDDGGIIELSRYIKFKKIVDRGWDFPSRDYVLKQNPGVMEKYMDFVEKSGIKYERFQVGSDKQFASKNKHFKVQNVASSCHIWTGEGLNSKPMYTAQEDTGRFDENMNSCVMTFTYGNFRYYNGGDIPGQPFKPGYKRNRDYEALVAPLIGHCNVIKANHHGTKDNTSANFLEQVKPEVIIFPSCEEHQPAASTLNRIAGTLPSARLFVTSEASRPTLGEELWKRFEGCGHIVIRVWPDGTYKVFCITL